MATLENALAQALVSAQRGFDVASQLISEAERAVDVASQSRIEGQARGVEACAELEDIEEQRQRSFSDWKSSLALARDNLETRREGLDEFSIALFGRTMSGKSTLMEILTNGDGSSIGKGAQGTTRDVSSYYWNGLKVIDTPGVAAFGGQQDIRLAFEAASKSDLVIYLITDDAPQPIEAELLAVLQATGKPLLGVCNIKAGFSGLKDANRFLKRSEKVFDQEKLAGVIHQFQEFIDSHIAGPNIEWVCVHLRSRHMADQPEYEEVRDELFEASRWHDLEQRIIREIVSKGATLRFKGFVDGAVVPISDLSSRLSEDCEQNEAAGYTMGRRHDGVEDWVERFDSRSRQRIIGLVEHEIMELRNRVPSFVESKLEDKNFFLDWEELVGSQGLANKIEALMKELSAEVETFFGELQRSLNQEISFLRGVAEDRSIKTGRIHDLRLLWAAGRIVSSCVVFVGSKIPGPGWVGAAIALGSQVVFRRLSRWFRGRRERKLAERRQELSRELHSLLDKEQRNLLEDSNLNLSGLVAEAGRQVKLIEDMAALVSQLAKDQRDLCWELNRLLKAAHYQLLEFALEMLRTQRMEGAVHEVARVAGEAMAISLKPGRGLTDSLRAGLRELMGERVLSFRHSQDPRVVVRRCIEEKCRLGDIEVDQEGGTARIRLRNEKPRVVVGVKLAQQLTGLRITR